MSTTKEPELGDGVDGDGEGAHSGSLGFWESGGGRIWPTPLPRVPGGHRALVFSLQRKSMLRSAMQNACCREQP